MDSNPVTLYLPHWAAPCQASWATRQGRVSDLEEIIISAGHTGLARRK